MNKNGISKILSAVRNFLFGFLNKEFLFFLFFLALSGIFWLMMSLNETLEREICIPMHLYNVPQNAVITDDLPDTLRVTVRDKGFTLVPYFYGSRIHPLYVNFSTYANKETGVGTVPLADVQRQVTAQLYGSTRITSVKPDKLTFYFNYGRSRKFPIHLLGKVIPGQSHYLAKTIFQPELVTVYANKKILDSIKYVETEILNIRNFEDTVVQYVALRPIRGAKIVPTRVRMCLYPDILTEESVEVPIIPINMPVGKTLRLFPSRVTVKFIVGASEFRKIKPEYFKVVADYEDIIRHPSDKCQLILKTYPHGVSKATLEHQQVDYLIEQQ